MKSPGLLCILFISFHSFASDSTFWHVARNWEVGEKQTIERSWGRENVTYLGMMDWKTASGKTVQIKIVTSYRQITKANGFNDQSIIALVKTNNHLIKTYDLVKRQNLPLKIQDNQLYYKPDGESEAKEILSALPRKFSERFCITGMTCYDEIKLHHHKQF
jgi:hypothetical protein